MLAYAKNTTPFIERDTKELNLAERLIKACEEGVKIYESGDLLTCFRRRLLQRKNPPHYFPRAYFVNQVNRFVPSSYGTQRERAKVIESMLAKLVTEGFLRIAAVVKGGAQYELTGLHTTSAAARLKEL